MMLVVDRIACFELEEFETAKRSFIAGRDALLQLQDDINSSSKALALYDRMIRKCDAELSGIRKS
jgi:hypothetical protein